MSIDYSAYLGRGWMLSEQDFEKAGLTYVDDFEEYLDAGYLTYVDAYTDPEPFFLGYRISEVDAGEVIAIDDVAPIPAEEEKIIKIAKEVFGITSPPALCLVSSVY